MAPGGYSDPPKKATHEVQDMCHKVKAAAEEKAGHKFAKFTAELFSTQVVAGHNYLIKVDVGGGQHAHLIVFQPLPCNGGDVKLTNIQYPKKEHDPLVAF